MEVEVTIEGVFCVQNVSGGTVLSSREVKF